MAGMIDIKTLDGVETFSAYCAQPAGTPKAAIIVIQEIFGVNPGIRAKCDHWAKLGYLALAPDMFWRVQPGVELDPDIPEELQEAFGLMQKYDSDLGIRDVEATIRHARKMVNGGKVGIVGYCLGGRTAYLAATRTDVDASVSYYGGGIDAMLNEAHAIANPLMLHFAELDHFITPDKVTKIEAAFADNRHVTIHRYPGVDHGFATETGKRRSEDAAQLADSRTEAFFAEHLKS